ncbi:MAG: siroheme decarboxylase [Clostridia bacterium]|nr:siroheme decarboxylase [Clostridia bacterium]
MAREITELEKKLIRRLQGDIPLERRPFQKIAAELGLKEEEVLQTIRRWQQEGIVRRFGAALRHREAGIMGNAMIVWQVPEERLEEVGRKLASFPEVTHCYQRRTLPGWPYNLFTMIHGRDRQVCINMARRLAEAVGIETYELVFSTAELKKTSMRYFEETLTRAK